MGSLFHLPLSSTTKLHLPFVRLVLRRCKSLQRLAAGVGCAAHANYFQAVASQPTLRPSVNCADVDTFTAHPRRQEPRNRLKRHELLVGNIDHVVPPDSGITLCPTSITLMSPIISH